jgi:hypothetical protein
MLIAFLFFILFILDFILLTITTILMLDKDEDSDLFKGLYIMFFGIVLILFIVLIITTMQQYCPNILEQMIYFILTVLIMNQNL